MTADAKNHKKTAVVICPGRGTYNKDELGYLHKYHGDKHAFIHAMDAYRRDAQQLSISDLDAADTYRLKLHATGDNASALIYTCAMADYQSIDQEQYDIVAVSGNSMGWYLALAASKALSLDNGMHVVNRMGTTMHKEAAGGQIIFPLCNEQWQADKDLVQNLRATVARLQENPANTIFPSIDLGGMSVLAANDHGLASLLRELPKTQGRYPFALPHHGAFHSPLMEAISAAALRDLSPALFAAPSVALIDGRGHIWQPHNTDVYQLHDYTFGQQVCETYNYSKAIEVACKEFAPDHLIILGPGASLGPPTAQQLINMQWLGIDSKDSFKAQQSTAAPFILSMGIDEQRTRVIASESQRQ